MPTLTSSLLGVFVIPNDICVSCAMPIGDSQASVKVSAGKSNQSLSLTFPLCAQCDAARKRADALQGKWTGIGCLISLPLGIAGYFVYYFMANRNTISWWGILLGCVLAFVLVYNIYSSRMYKKNADPQDQKAASAVEISGFTEAHAWTDGAVELRFENETYAREFQAANPARKWKMSE